jgi:hypothetical protein
VIRDLTACHDLAVLGSPHVGAAMAIHWAAFGVTLVELPECAGRSGPTSRAIARTHDCGDCRLGALCPTGLRLARAIGSRSSRKHSP